MILWSLGQSCSGLRFQFWQIRSRAEISMMRSYWPCRTESSKTIRRSIFKPLRFLLTVVRILQEGRYAQVLYVNGLYLEAVVANFFLRKPLVQKIVGDWAWERATNKGWVEDSFEEFQRRKYGLKL